MLQFSCLSCGSALNTETGTSVCECVNCGVVQATPVLLNPEMLSLYTKACDCLRDGNTVSAFRMCEEITSVFPESACSHWLAVLAQYGVEYVRMADATSPRAESGLLNVLPVRSCLHYVAAQASADTELSSFLDETAAIIDEQQNRLRQAALQSQVFDVFITCNPAGDDSISQTDRKVAVQLYHRLVKNGLRVYLRGVCGETDEASVFSALHSAKVMFLVGGTSQILLHHELQRDWARYLQISCDTDRGQLIILHDRMPEDELPEILSSYKHCYYRNGGSVAAFVRLATESARNFAQNEDAQSRAQTLAADAVAHQFDVAMQLREKQEQKAALFASLCAKQRSLATQKECEELAAEFRRLSDYRDASDRALACARKAEQYRFNAMREKETGRLLRENKKYTQTLEEKERKEKRESKKKQERLILTACTLFFVGLCSAVVLLFTQLILPFADYNRAQELQTVGELESAYEIYEKLGSFMDSEEQRAKIEDIISSDVPLLPFSITRMK
ncbi:MAG: hypothetical protein E7523_09245 [Ruminococcaceae bacterium]|nr:hypothetical protein [Oscillospiraceae bacterium]